MALEPVPDGGYVAALAALVVAMGGLLVGMIKRMSGRRTENLENEAFRKQILSDVHRMEGIVKTASDRIERALIHADQIHEGLKLSIGEQSTRLAVIENEITHLRNGKK